MASRRPTYWPSAAPRSGSYGVEVIEDTVLGIDAGFVVRLGSGKVLRARRVLVAAGVRDALPDIPGVQERWGRDLLHCPYCHGWEVRDQPLGVLGTRPDAVQHALLVRQWSDDVVFFAHTLDLDADAQQRLAARGVTVVAGAVARLVVEADRLTGVELRDGRVIARSAVFIRPVNVPHPDGLLTGLGCDLDSTGFPVVDVTGRTSIAGVWAAGNVVDPRLQVISSAGAGSTAAIAINADLVLALDPKAHPSRWREAEFSGELADLVGVVAGHLVERVLHQVSVALHDRPRLRVQAGRLGVATDRFAVAAQDVRVGGSDDARVAHANDCAPTGVSLVDASHRDDDLPHSVPGFQIPESVRDLGERVASVDDRPDDAGIY